MDVIWNIQTSDHICDLYTKCLLKPLDRKLAWEHWRGKSKDSSITNWHPGMTLDKNPQNCNSYKTCFPIIINKAYDCRKVLEFRVDKTIPPHHTWLNLPRLDFLPSHVNDVMAGDGGLLCVNGGEPSLIEYSFEHQSLYGSKSKHKNFKVKNLFEQSILLICNPLTKEIKYLPQQTYCVNNSSLARMILFSPRAQAFVHDENPKRHQSNYKVIVVGNHRKLDKQLKQSVQNEVVFLTYDSNMDEWTPGTCIQNARLVMHIKSDIAVVGNCLFVGGQSFMGYKKECINKIQIELWDNKLFKVNILDGTWNAIDFCVEDCTGKTIRMQAPIIVQCKPNGEVYAISRKKVKPSTIHIYQVMFVRDNPTGVMKILACMPEHVHVALFEEKTSLKAYECTAGVHFISFLASFSSQSVVAVFDLCSHNWFVAKRPIDHGCLSRFSLARCEWIPNFVSKP